MRIAQVFVVRARFLHLQNFRAQIAHRDAPVNRIRRIRRVFEQQVRVAGFELDLGERGEELARVDEGLANAVVCKHLLVFCSDIDIRERHAVHALHVVRAEQCHLLAALRQLERDVGDHHAERERFDADLLVRVLALGVEELQDVGVMRVQIHRAGTLASAELVRIAERVLEQFHHGDDSARLVLDVLDRRALLPQIAQQQCHAAAAFAQLERRVDAA